MASPTERRSAPYSTVTIPLPIAETIDVPPDRAAKDEPIEDRFEAALRGVAEGDPHAVEALIELSYAELRAMAAARLRRGEKTPSLHPTEIVHAAFERLSPGARGRFDSRAHFFGSAARAMRHVIVDRLRAQSRQKRGADFVRIDLDEAQTLSVGGDKDPILDLDELLRALEAEDPRSAKVAELRLFGGLAEAEIAEALQISDRTVRREWTFARAWLARRLEPETPQPPPPPATAP